MRKFVVEVVFCFVIVCPIYSVLAQGSSSMPTLYSRGFSWNTQVLAVVRVPEARLFSSTDGFPWKEFQVAGTDSKNILGLSFLSDGSWIALGYDRCWVTSNKGLVWSVFRTPRERFGFSSPEAVAKLSVLGSFRIEGPNLRLPSLVVGSELIECFYDVSIISKNAAVAIVNIAGGERSRDTALVASDDGGRNWRWYSKDGRSYRRGGMNFAHHMFFLSSLVGWISSDIDDNILATADGGVNWSRIVAPDRVISGMFFRDQREGVVMGGSTARIYKTTDGGKSWLELDDAEVLNERFVDYLGGRQTLWLSGFGLYRSTLLLQSGRR